MTALARISPSVSEAIDWSRWIDAREAAMILGVNRDSLTRLCRQQLADEGKAQHLKGPEGGQARWFIARSYDLKLGAGALGKSHQIPEAFWEDLTEQQREIAWQRVKCVEIFREAQAPPGAGGRSGAQKDWLPQILRDLAALYPNLSPSRATLLRWHKAYRNPADIMKLADKRGGNMRGDPDPAAFQFFKELYMGERRWSLSEAHRRVKREAEVRGWTWLNSEGAVRAYVKKRIARQDLAKSRNPEEWRTYYRAWLEQDPEGFAAGECWIGDHAQLDVIVQNIGPKGVEFVRPWLTAWMDWRTRRIMGWFLSTAPNSSTILAALRRGLLDPNLVTMPSHVWIDNGKDYDCYVFHGQTKRQRQMQRGFRGEVDEAPTAGLLNTIGIEAHFSIPHNPNGKSRLEHWFGYGLHEVFDKMYATYCGGESGSRPEYLNELMATGVDAPTFAELSDELDLHIAGFNAFGDHNRQDMRGFSPDEYLAKFVKTRRLAIDPAALDAFLLKHHKPVTMGKNGISLHIAGAGTLRFGQFTQELQRFKAKSKHERETLNVLYDPKCLASIRVFDSKMRFICEAPANEIHGRHVKGDAASEERFKRAMRLKRNVAKQEEFVRKHRHVSYTSLQALAAREAAEEQRAARPAVNPDAPLSPVRTPLDGRTESIEESVMLQQAAGAEVVTPQNSASKLMERVKRANQQARSAPRFVPPPLNLDRLNGGANG